jgi:hypothetical protein
MEGMQHADSWLLGRFTTSIPADMAVGVQSWKGCVHKSSAATTAADLQQAVYQALASTRLLTLKLTWPSAYMLQLRPIQVHRPPPARSSDAQPDPGRCCLHC